ncbi:hypothetical protein [Novosphingobium colocasiae]|uniref:hypothetical protein n=1 Tax=Novosphingobium colocasiae TaxID=1256513 RepID=UPI0035B36FE6
MKLLRWAVGGASVYVIYKYSIGRKAKGEDVFVNADQAVQDLADTSGKAAVAEKAEAAE